MALTSLTSLSPPPTPWHSSSLQFQALSELCHMWCWSPAQPQPFLSLAMGSAGTQSCRMTSWLDLGPALSLWTCPAITDGISPSLWPPDLILILILIPSLTRNWFFQLHLGPASDVFNELDSWLTTAASCEYVLLPHSGCVTGLRSWLLGEPHSQSLLCPDNQALVTLSGFILNGDSGSQSLVSLIYSLEKTSGLSWIVPHGYRSVFHHASWI